MPAPTRRALTLLNRRDIAAPALRLDGTDLIHFHQLLQVISMTISLKKKCVDPTVSNLWLFLRVDSDPIKSLATFIQRGNLALELVRKLPPGQTPKAIDMRQPHKEPETLDGLPLLLT
jgi:hypothetical protein